MRVAAGSPNGSAAGAAGPRRRVRDALPPALALALAACATVQVHYPDGRTERHSREAFASYVEAVFRYQNRVVNDLIVATSLSPDPAALEDAALMRAERDMAAACQALNTAVAARLEGREIGFFHKLELPRAVPACEAASRRLEQLLPGI